MASNFDFLKSTDRKLFEMIEIAEQLYRDEYFDQAIVQIRKFAENICKKLLGKARTTEKTFDDTLATLCDKSTGSQQEKEVIEDLYFIKKEGNLSAHTQGQELPATTALECLQRAFEVSVNFAFSRNPNNKKILKLQFDTELLITGEKTKKNLKEKFLEAKKQTIVQTKRINKSKQQSKKVMINEIQLPKLKGALIFIIILFAYVLCLLFN